MSRYFRGANESSDTESESNDEEMGFARPAAKQAVGKSYMPSDSEEETKRIVRPAKDKRYDELKEQMKIIRNCKKIKDCFKILSTFENMCKSYEKARGILAKEGGMPRFYLRFMCELEEFVEECWEDREGRQNMSKNNARSLTTLRQKLRRYRRDNEEAFTEYLKDPDPEGYSSVGSEEYAESDKMASSDEEIVQKTVKKERKPLDEDEETDSEWESSGSESSSESSLDELEGKGMEELRKYFLKKEATAKDEEKIKRRQQEREERRERAERRRVEREKMDDDEGGEWEHVDSKAKERPKLFEKDAEITHEAVIKKLSEIISARGKKGTDRREQTDSLKELAEIARSNDLGAALYCKVKFAAIASLFDYNPKLVDSMTYANWQSSRQSIGELVEALGQNPRIKCTSDVMEDEEILVQTDDPSQELRLHGCLLSMLERLDDEFTKILQTTDCHSTDYVETLKGEQDLIALMYGIRDYCEAQKFPEAGLCRIYSRLIQHIYYKFDANSVEDVEDVSDDCNYKVLGRLCEYVYTHDATRMLRTRALLCHVYQLALHDRWRETRDLLLMSHLQATIDHSDIQTQIMYNRAICQMGLCAFRHGNIRVAHNALSDIQNSGKARELLAQGVSMRRDQEKTPEQEKIEKQRQVPYHMHINLELLECIYLITAMLLEIPQMASKEFEVRRRLISRSFHYQLKQSERQSLLGPPETTREHVVAAAKCLFRGNWHGCKKNIVNDKMNAKVWNLFHRCDHVREMLLKQIQEESLHTYLLAYATSYDTISIGKLSAMFEMPKASVHSIISKMIINEELSASLDEPNECIVIYRVEPTRLQTLCLQFAEKLNSLADNNEQILDPRSNQNFSGYRTGGNWFQHRQQQGGSQQTGGRQQYQRHQQQKGY